MKMKKNFGGKSKIFIDNFDHVHVIIETHDYIIDVKFGEMLEKLENIWRNIGEKLGKLEKCWRKIGEIGESGEKLEKIWRSWRKFEEVGESLKKLGKIFKFFNHYVFSKHKMYNYVILHATN